MPAFHHDREVYAHAEKATGALLSFLRTATDYGGKPKDPLVVTALAAISLKRTPAGPEQAQPHSLVVSQQDLGVARIESKDASARERRVVSLVAFELTYYYSACTAPFSFNLSESFLLQLLF